MTADEFQRSGLLWLANRAIHPFGVAIAVVRNEDGSIQDGLTLIETDDPNGFVFSEEQENECRVRFFDWIRGRA